MRLGAWLPLLARNRFRVQPGRLPMAGAATVFAAVNSVLAGVSHLLYSRRIRKVEINEPPLFIIGHWRSGTTFMHELVSLDDRFTAPTTCQCLLPHHFLLTEWWLTHFFNWVVPQRRSMDNVELSWHSPQEDEFALLNLGTASPYARMAFPLHPAPWSEYLNMSDVPAVELEAWSESLLMFLRRVAYRNPGRLALKSPTHTGRIALLATLFPGAKFIHMTRDPYALFPSTMRLWKSLDVIQAFQVGDYDEALREYVFQSMRRMYDGFRAGRSAIADDAIYEIRYEDLAADPVGQLAAAYKHLDLGGFDQVRAAAAQFTADKSDYRPSRHQLDEPTRAAIAEHWADYFEQFGYDV